MSEGVGAKPSGSRRHLNAWMARRARSCSAPGSCDDRRNDLVRFRNVHRIRQELTDLAERAEG